MLPDAGTPPIVTGTFGSCGSFNPCAGNLQGTWFRTAVCVEPSNPFGTACPTGSLISYSGSGAGRLDFLGQDLIRTYGPSSETYVANYPQACLTGGFATTCSALESLLSSAGFAASCPPATAGRTGCDCTLTITSAAPSSTQTTWTDNGGGVITVNDGMNPFQWRTCVMTGNPDTLILTGSDGLGRQTWQRR